MPARKDPVRIALQFTLYVLAYFGAMFVAGPIFRWVGGDFAGLVTAHLFSALTANWLALRFFTELRLAAIGLWWNRAAADNLAWGLAGGIGAACLALVPALAFGAAHFIRTPAEQPSWAAPIFLTALLAIGSAAEEILFRGYGFQLLIANAGPAAATALIAAAFGLLHLANPHATWLGAANTVGFGAVFCFAYLRSRDLWLPIGLHFGWNFTLPLFGANVSGLRMKVTGYEMSWTAGALWSGGDYGPEASILTSAVMVLLFYFVWKAPVRRQSSPLTDPPTENAVCEPSLPLPS
jgi:membrane protease YdiL (CAAX protease family)